MANLIYKGLKANLPESRNATSFYLCTDTRELYFGADLYTEAVRFYDGDKPASPAQGILYISNTTGAGDVYTGSAWKSVFTAIVTKTVATTIGASASDAEVPTAKAVKDYVAGITGSELGALAHKDEVAEEDLADTLVAKLNGKAEDADLQEEITRAKAAEKKNADAIDVLNGTGAGSVDKKITDAFNDFATKVSDDAVVNTYKELIDWAATHGTEAAEMAAEITALQNILAGIGGEGEKDTVIAYVQDAIAALNIGDYAKASELTALADRVAAAEGKLTTLNGDETTAGSVKKALKDAKGYADGLNTAMDTRVTAVEGKAHEHANKDELDKIATGDKAKWDDAAGKAHEHANKAELDKIAVGDKAKWDAAEQNAKDYADSLADNYDAAGAAATAEQNAKNYADGLNTAMDTRVTSLEEIVTVGTF